MKRETEIKSLIISNAIRLIAEGGFEKATTKELAYSGGNLPDQKMNEVYIYRLFGSKEEVYEEAFLQLDRELFSVIAKEEEAFDAMDGNIRECLYDMFSRIWCFVVGNEERCRCYVRYYYSIYFKGKSFEAHQNRFNKMVVKMSHLFKEEAEVYAILHSVFIMLFDFSIRVYNGEIEDNDINRPHIFNVLYCMMMTYFKDTPAIV